MLHEFSRTEMIIGTKALNRLRNSVVAVFGIGGVGTFAVEGLSRSGIGKFILVDDDEICLTNINRQLHATRKTIGKPKVEVMKERILDINPNAEVITYQELYNSESADRLFSHEYDYVVDAIDMVSAKLHLIERCNTRNIPAISSMGAGNKLNPAMLQVDDIYNTTICPLARIMRRELRKRGIEKLKVVYSKEKPIKPITTERDCDIDSICPSKDRIYIKRRQIPGSISFVPSVAGLIIASEIVKDIIEYKE